MTVMRAVVVVLIAALAVVAVTGAGAAGAQAGPPTTQAETPSTFPPPEDAGGIIPRPNSGREPESPFDRGGAAQLALLGLVLVGLGTIGGLIAWESRKRRRAAPAGPAAPTPRPDRTSGSGTRRGG